jgi:hypothetical protein
MAPRPRQAADVGQPRHAGFLQDPDELGQRPDRVPDGMKNGHAKRSYRTVDPPDPRSSPQ